MRLPAVRISMLERRPRSSESRRTRSPRVREFLEGIKIQAREQGYVETVLHRRRYIQDIRSPNRMLRQGAERIAINMPVQGSAADIMKLAMIRLQNYMREQRLSRQTIPTGRHASGFGGTH